eukprot:scaffold141547_cov47-Attheya_sp.AAC.1
MLVLCSLQWHSCGHFGQCHMSSIQDMVAATRGESGVVPNMATDLDQCCSDIGRDESDEETKERGILHSEHAQLPWFELCCAKSPPKVATFVDRSKLVPCTQERAPNRVFFSPGILSTSNECLTYSSFFFVEVLHTTKMGSCHRMTPVSHSEMESGIYFSRFCRFLYHKIPLLLLVSFSRITHYDR